MKYKDRHEQSAYLREKHGVKYSRTTLQKMGTTGGGPKYVLFGGRALSTDEWLDEWVAAKMWAPRNQHQRRGGMIHAAQKQTAARCGAAARRRM